MRQNAIEGGFSLARGFVVLTMPAIHSVLFYGETEVKEGPLGIILGFLAETAGAPVFMLLMGVFIAYSSPKLMCITNYESLFCKYHKCCNRKDTD